MLKKIISDSWSPWFSGIVLAFLFLISMYVLGEPAGTNSAYSELLDNCKVILFNKEIPVLDWEVMFLVGVFFGSVIAAVFGKTFKPQLFPEDHMSRGASFYLGLGPVYLFLGGLFVMLGLIIAGNSFLKLWNDSLALYMIVGLFLIIVFVEAVLIGTMLSIKIEAKSKK